MGRFFNREAAVVAVVLLLVSLGVGTIAGLRPWLIVAVSAGVVALLHWPLTISFQGWVLEYYVEHGRLARALDLAIELRDSSVTRSEREKATLDVAFVHMARGSYEYAIENLRRLVTSTMKPITKAVVDASWGYCLGHLGRDLDKAEELIQASMKAAPQEPLFGYFLAVVRLKQGRLADARSLIEESLKAEPDLTLPHPGERPYVLAQVLKGLGDEAGSRAQLERARAAKGRFAELAAKDLAA